MALVINLDVSASPQTVPLNVDTPVVEQTVNGDYTQLRNLPTLNGEEIIGDKSFEDYGEQTITNAELQNIINAQYNLIFGGGSNA